MWPQYILDQFSRISTTDIEHNFGPHLPILTVECYSDSQALVIHPQCSLPDAPDSSVSLDDQIDARRCHHILNDQRMNDRFRCLCHPIIHPSYLEYVPGVKPLRFSTKRNLRSCGNRRGCYHQRGTSQIYVRDR